MNNKLQRIYIPTLGRVDKQVTYSNMPDWVKDITYFVIQPHEEEIFRKTYPNSNIKVLPLKIKGIARTREWIINDGGDDLYGMIDDDVTFWKRNVDRDTLKKNSDKSNEQLSSDDWKEMIEWIEGIVDTKWTIAGNKTKGLPPSPKEYSDFGKLVAVYWINGSKLRREELKWDIEYGEDIHFLLQVVSMGSKFGISDKWLHESEGQYSEGGCQQQGRTMDKEELCVKEISLRYPNVITISDEVIELRDGVLWRKQKIDWRRAYNPYYGRVVTHQWF
jgi:hypothetical protein